MFIESVRFRQFASSFRSEMGMVHFAPKGAYFNETGGKL